jgi:hypothetical protein
MSALDDVVDHADGTRIGILLYEAFDDPPAMKLNDRIVVVRQKKG